MDLFGIGGMELVAILVVALIVLGPGRFVDGLRTAGRYWGQARRLLREIADSATVNISDTGVEGQSASRDRENISVPPERDSGAVDGDNSMEQDEHRG